MFCKNHKKSKTVLNNKGSALTLAVLLSVVLFITLSFTLSSVYTNETVRNTVTDEEYAYLAAKSGVEIFKGLANDEDASAKVLSARGSTNPIKIPLGDLGDAEIIVHQLTKWVQDRNNDGSLKFESDGFTPIMVEVVDDEHVKIECTGKYGKSAFKLVRYESVMEQQQPSQFPFEKKAYTQYGDHDIYITGNIDGPVLLYGDAKINVFDAQYLGVDHRMHEIIASGNVDLRPLGGSGGGMASSNTYFAAITAGGHLIIPEGENVEGDVLVGSKKDDGTVKDGVYFYSQGAQIGGAAKCEGDIILGNSSVVGYSNLDDDGNCKADDVVLASNGSIYIGYECTPNDTGYSNLSPENSTKHIWGRVVAGGDVKIYGSAIIEGDIYAQGDVYLDSYPTIKGNIYAGGNIIIGAYNNNTFVSGKELWAGGTVSASPSNVAVRSVAAGTLSQGDLDNKLLDYFDGRDLIGADQRLEDEKIKSPKPRIKIPEKFTNGTVLEQAFGSHICTGCTDPNFSQHIPHQAMETCWWCTDAPYYDPSMSPPHTPHQKQASWMCSGCGDMAYNTHTPHPLPNQGPITIDADCIINEDITIDGNNPSGCTALYINASQHDVDILLKGTITTTNNGNIYINDGAGTHRIRIFMDDNAKLNLGNVWGGQIGMVPISDGAKDITVDQLPTSFVGDPKVEAGKVPQLYFFSRDGGNPEINITGSAAYLPAYVIAPDLTINVTDGSGRGGAYSNGDQVSFESGHYPYMYGLFTVRVCNFEDTSSTHIKYDSTLEDMPDGTQSPNGLKFSNAIADVVYYDNP